MSIENKSATHEHPIGPVYIRAYEAMGSMPHRRLRFPSVDGRDNFLSRAMAPLEGPNENDFRALEAPANGGTYDMFFRKGELDVTVRAWTQDPEAGATLDDFIETKLD